MKPNINEMSFISEIFTLYKMMKGSIDVNEITPYPMKHIPFKGYKYMMWCANIIYRESRPYDANMDDESKNHETIHLYQAKDKGSWFKYYKSYAWQWMKNIFTKRNGAYYINKYEVEAYAKEKDLTYLERRKPNNVELFKIDKKEFTKFSNTYQFKEYIREKYKDI